MLLSKTIGKTIGKQLIIEKGEIMDKKKILWFLVFVLLVGLTLYTLITTSKTFSFDGFVTYMKQANPFWIVCAVICMLLYILFEGISIKCLTGFLGTKTSVRKGFIYSAADIFFSAITPSATGGQPASAFFMMTDGIPASVTAMSLILNIALYTVSIIIIGLVSVIFFPGVYMNFDMLSRVLVVLGFVIQIVCVASFLIVVYKDKVLFKILDKLIGVAKKLHLTKSASKKRKKLEKIATEYKECSSAVANRFGIIVKILIYNILQRLSQIGVTACVFLAVGGNVAAIPRVFATQGCVILGSNAVPVPGAVGVADYLFLEGFRGVVPESDIINIELLSRGISFYGCIILCVIIVAVCYLIDKKRIRKAKEG